MEMKTLLLGVGLGALIGLSALTTPAQIKQTTAAQANATALRQYQWKLRTEVQRKGETKSVQLAAVRYDANGQMQTTLISKTPEPDLPKFGLRKAVAEKKFKEFKGTVQQLGELARAYGNLPADQMQHFMATAVITPELSGGQKLLRAEGHDVFQNGDTMVVWLDAVTRKQRRIDIQAAYDGKPVRIVSEFRELPQGGPTYLATSQIAYDNGEVVIVTTNFDHERLRAETAVAAPAAAAAPAPAAASATAAGPIVTDNGWPRKFAVGGSSFAVYQPQMEQWEGNQWLGRAAFSVANGSAAQPSYGVLWFAARTEIDKAKRLVSFSDIRVTRVNFPSAPEKASLLQSALQSHAQQRGEAIALDRLLAEMAANDADRASASVGYNVKNDPPRVFFSTRAAILVLIDGPPVFRQVEDTDVERVINARVLILRNRRTHNFYLRLMNGWLEADDLMASWQPAATTPKDLKKALELAAASKQVDLLNGPAASTAISEIYVSTEPAELLQTNGDPQIAAIPNTDLVYVTNTDNDIFVHTTTQAHYILLSGRWFSAQSMRGPWTYVAPDKLPADFARIPATHEKANVLVSVAGTPQAKEALIANSIPQTETVSRATTTINVSYDGTPQFKPIENTTLQYAVNTSTPVIVVNPGNYYAVQNGVWFVATSAAGPWVVAATVPSVIYSIPVASPLHYVTYVKIYGSTPQVVYVGYTPGYYGTVVTASNVVVYGTGWYYPPYVGAYWYGAPYTYGYGVVFNWGVASGWGYAYANSYYYASGTRAAWANAYTGNVGHAAADTGTTANGTRYTARGFTNTNVYTGNSVTAGGAVAYNPNTGRIAAGQAGAVSNAYNGNAAAGARGVTYNPNTGVISGGAVGGVRNGSTGAVTTGGGAFAYNPNTNNGVAVANNNVYADRNGNIYRYNQSTGVQQRTDNGWETVQRSQDRSWVQNQHQARSRGQERTQNFNTARANSGTSRPNFSGASRPNFSGGFRGRRR